MRFDWEKPNVTETTNFQTPDAITSKYGYRGKEIGVMVCHKYLNVMVDLKWDGCKSTVGAVCRLLARAPLALAHGGAGGEEVGGGRGQHQQEEGHHGLPDHGRHLRGEGREGRSGILITKVASGFVSW